MPESLSGTSRPSVISPAGVSGLLLGTVFSFSLGVLSLPVRDVALTSRPSLSRSSDEPVALVLDEIDETLRRLAADYSLAPDVWVEEPDVTYDALNHWELLSSRVTDYESDDIAMYRESDFHAWA